MTKKRYLSKMKTKSILCAFSPLLLAAGCAEVAQAPERLEVPAIPQVNGLMDVRTSEIREYKGFTLSYNKKALIPDWVAYELTAEETRGRATREDKSFGMDMSYKGKQARREDYKDSGWSRGHMAPAGDFFWSDEAMEETFYLLNICPQNEYLNNKDWQYLEKQVRRWAVDYGRAWVVTGPIIGKNRYGKIGESRVTVPDAFFKAVLVRDDGGYEGVGFVMQNDSKRYYLEKCAVTLDSLEKMTGIDFFPALPDKVEDFIESTYDPSVWNLIK